MQKQNVERLQPFLDDPALFIVTYFSHRIKKLEEFHLKLIETATTQTKGLVLYPAAHGKTTLISEILPIYELCRNPNVRIAIIAKNDQDANKIMGSIISELLNNDELIRDYGPFKSEKREVPFGLRSLSVAKRTLRHKSPTIAAFGANSRNALGHRTDLTICDDIVTDENSGSPDRRATLKEWFNQGPSTMGEEVNDRLIVVGTLFDPEDLYHDIMLLRDADTGEPVYHTDQFDAIADEEEHLTLWPARWPWKRLMQKKGEVGTLDFNKRYRNIAVDASRMVFREEYVKGGWIGKEKYPGCLDDNHRIEEFDETWRTAAGFDPAVGITRSRKFCAHVVLADGMCKEHERCLWVVDLKRDQMTLPQQVNLIIAEHQRYDLLVTNVEANSYQAGLYQAINDKMEERNVNLRIDPHYTNRSNKQDPEIGVAALSPWFENGKVHIPWGDQASRRKMKQLVDELVEWPGRYTDSVMAFWMAFLALEDAAPKFKSFNRLERQAPFFHRMARPKMIRNPAYTRQTEVVLLEDGN